MAALTHHAAGDGTRALALASTHLRHADAWGIPSVLGRALVVRGVVDPGSERLRFIEDGVAVLAINGLFLLMGVVGLEHQYRQARKSESAEFTAYVARGFRAVDVTSSVVIGVLLLGAAALISRSGQSTPGGLVAAGIVVAVAVGNLAREAHQWHLVQQSLSDMTA